jgi:hypothetical protein
MERSCLAVHETLDDAHISLIAEGNRLGFVLRDVARDGNCLYKAVQTHPSLTPCATTSSELRRQVVWNLKLLPDAKASFVPNHEGYGTPRGAGYATWHDYLHAIEVPPFHTKVHTCLATELYCGGHQAKHKQTKCQCYTA